MLGTSVLAIPGARDLAVLGTPFRTSSNRFHIDVWRRVTSQALDAQIRVGAIMAGACRELVATSGIGAVGPVAVSLH